MTNIQTILNNVDYSFPNYVPSKEAIAFVQFIKEVSGGSEENKTPIIHLKMLDLIFKKNVRRKAVMCFRGGAKTSIGAEFGLLWAACFNSYLGLDDVTVAMYVASSLEKGAKDLRRSIESRYNNSPFLQRMIPNKKILATDTTSKHPMQLSENDVNDLLNAGKNITDIRLEFVNVNKKPFVVRLFGVASGIRGFKEYAVRPQIAILDDLLSDQDARSATVMDSIEEVVYKAVAYALHPQKQVMLWLGTPFNSSDPLYKAIESGVWESIVLPVCEKFPCEKEEFRGAWTDRFDYESVMNSYQDAVAKGAYGGFYQEMMLQVISDELLIIRKENIKYLDSKDLNTRLPQFNYYITTDFAFTEKTASDFSVISVWAYTSNKEWILVDGICKKQVMALNIADLFRLVSIYRPIQVGIEVTGQQGGFLSWIRNEMYKSNLYFNIKEIRPAKDKFSRFLGITPQYHSGKIFFNKNIETTNPAFWNEIMDELLKVTSEGFKSKHDDVLDTHSMLLDLEAFAPSNSSTANEVKEEKKSFSMFDYMERYKAGGDGINSSYNQSGSPKTYYF